MREAWEPELDHVTLENHQLNKMDTFQQDIWIFCMQNIEEVVGGFCLHWKHHTHPLVVEETMRSSAQGNCSAKSLAALVMS